MICNIGRCRRVVGEKEQFAKEYEAREIIILRAIQDLIQKKTNILSQFVGLWKLCSYVWFVKKAKAACSAKR